MKRQRPSESVGGESRQRADSFLSGWAATANLGSGCEEELYLGTADPKLGALIARVVDAEGAKRFRPSTAESHFDAIARSIVYQQLSKKAASTIYARFVNVVGGSASPERVLEASSEALRGAGLSYPKVRYLKALAAAVVCGDLDLDALSELPDGAIIHALTSVSGIGVWTAQMFLMFRLLRPDVLPSHDVGLQRGLQVAYGLRKPAAPAYVNLVGKRWAPYRSLACLYLWAAVDLGMFKLRPLPDGE